MLEESLRMIEESLPETLEEFRAMGLAKDGMYKRLEFALQCLFDELSGKRKELSEEPVFGYGDVIAELHEKGVLNDELREKAEFLLQLREILIYNYDLINDEIAFRNMREYLEAIRDVRRAL